MLPAASNLFLSEIGRGHLHKLHSLDESDKVRPLSIVVKKKRWYWFHSKVDPTCTHIGDLLKSGQTFPGVEIKEASEVTDFESSTTFSVKGEIGGKLAKLFQVKLSASDQIQFHAPLGKIMMNSIDPSQLCKILSSLEIDTGNVYVSGCLNNTWKRSMNLAVVTETWYVANEVKLTASVDIKATADASAPADVGHASGSIEKTKEFNFTLQRGTAIAYQTIDLKIDKNGKIRCVPDAVSMKMYCGFCFFSQDTVDGDDSSSATVSEIRSLPAAELKLIRENFIAILGHPALVKKLFFLIDGVENKDENLKLDVEFCDEKEKNAVRVLLTTAGLVVSDEFSVLPGDTGRNAFFEAVAVLVSALRDLPDEVIVALDGLSDDEIQPVADSVRALLSKWEASGEIDATVVVDKLPSVDNFLHTLGVFRENGFAKHHPRVLEALFRVISCLYDINMKK